jgi:hypothetical protein
MKSIKVLLCIVFCFVSANTFAQNPKAIEADLLRSFKKIGYWDQKRSNAGVDDSLENANNVFENKLKNYTEKYSTTIQNPFNSLKKEGINILTSTDGIFRIYSWDSQQGGTMYAYTNLMQYKAGQKTNSKLFTSGENGFEASYSNLYTFKTGDKTYYITIYGGPESSRFYYAGVKTFAIENGQLNDNVKIIKTKSGLQNAVQYEFDFAFNNSWDEVNQITFDAATKTIKIPLVTEKGKITRKYITYKFNGQYFEKVKN